MADKIRLIDANALRLIKVAECAEHTIEFAAGWKACVEYCKNDAPTIEAQPVAETDARLIELSQLLEDYGFEDTDTLRFALEQYQKVISEITHGRLSKLTYSADTIVNMEEDVSREYWEKELVKHGKWINDESSIPRCSECSYIPEFNRYIDDYYYSDYCPNCGCYMREDGDSND